MEIVVGVFFFLVVVLGGLSVKIIKQSRNAVVERLGRYSRTLNPGWHLIIPGIEYIAFDEEILERQLEEIEIETITSDNVPITLLFAIFYRITALDKVAYRIGVGRQKIDRAIETVVSGVVRSEIGKSDFDGVQRNRQLINEAIRKQLSGVGDEWGMLFTRHELLDIKFDDDTKESMAKQIRSERERRAEVAKAEGEKQAEQLRADARLYAAEKDAEAKKVTADAEAYATTNIGKAVAQDGNDAIRLEVFKEQASAIKALAESDNSKIVLLPNTVLEAVTDLAVALTRGRS